MELTEITHPKLAADFIQVNILINKGNPNYIRPLDKDIDEIFNEKLNKTFRFGKCTRWILRDENGQLIGRIAAFVNKKYKNKGDEVPIGGIGFFDCINNQDAAAMLFDVAKHWLLQQGMEAMDGPINFGERDSWWGLVVDGFQEPLYKMNYNAPYYQALFENYGFKNFYNQICYGLDPKARLTQKFYERHAQYADNPDYKSRHIKKNQLLKYASDFTIVYNKAWAGHGGLKELKKDQVILMFNKMKPFMDEKLIWFSYYKEAPISMFVNLPDLNQLFKHLNGKLGLLQKIKFLWLAKTMKNKKFNGIVFGIVPEFQGKGIDAYMVVESSKIIQPYTSYTEYEMQWIGEFNPKMINVVKGLGETFPSRTLTTYRYLFDQTREFKRHPAVS